MKRPSLTFVLAWVWIFCLFVCFGRVLFVCLFLYNSVIFHFETTLSMSLYIEFV